MTARAGEVLVFRNTDEKRLWQQEVASCQGTAEQKQAHADQMVLAFRRRAVGAYLTEGFTERSVRTVSEIVASRTGVAVPVMQGAKRQMPIVRARHLAMYCCRVVTGASLVSIGEFFNCDHTTVIHAVRKVTAEAVNDAANNHFITSLVEEARKALG